jgi:Peroxisome biogenesis factor 1, N-terminal
MKPSLQYTKSDVIELPRSLLLPSPGPNSHSSSISFNLPEHVSVSALSRVPHATRVHVRPLTTEDWELLEVHGDVMEQGGWLGQVSLVNPGQRLVLRVGGDGRDRIHLVVKEAVGGGGKHGNAPKHSSSLWPALPNTSLGSVGDFDDDDDDVEPPCFLLVQDTEVIVEPKPRQTKKGVPWSSPLRLVPCQLDWSQGTLDTLSRMTNHSGEYPPFEVDAGCIVVNHDAWTHESHWARIRPESKAAADQERMVRVVKSSRISPDDAGRMTEFFFCIFRVRFL